MKRWNGYYVSAFSFWLASLGMLIRDDVPKWSMFFIPALVFYLLGHRKAKR